MDDRKRRNVKAYRARHRAKGLCRQCPNHLATYKHLCDDCMGKHRAYKAKKRQELEKKALLDLVGSADGPPPVSAGG